MQEGMSRFEQRFWGKILAPIGVVLFFLFFVKPPPQPAPYVPPKAPAPVDPTPDNIELVKHKSPPLDLPGLDGQRYQLAGYKGQILVVVVRGSWCEKCDTDLDDLEQMKSSYRGKPVRFLAIDGDQTFQKLGASQMKPEELRDFVSRHSLTFPVVLATDKAWKAWELTSAGEDRGMPLTYVIDQKGRVRYEKSLATPQEIHAAIDKLLESIHEVSEDADPAP